ncbi:unnamed protein product [Amoebophrya sp. A25]|nr:unnamed protein product [Amoebophrya sp. A25]|eukprot:GSA25T00024236001.1
MLLASACRAPLMSRGRLSAAPQTRSSFFTHHLVPGSGNNIRLRFFSGSTTTFASSTASPPISASASFVSCSSHPTSTSGTSSTAPSSPRNSSTSRTIVPHSTATTNVPRSFSSTSAANTSSAATTPASAFYCLFYTYCEGILEKRGPFRPGHLALAEGLYKEGKLVLGGAFGDLGSAAASGEGGQNNDALFIFKGMSPDEIETEFVKKDPYVANNLAIGYRIRPWTVPPNIGGGA